ncbi:MAG: DNA polymerase III subunit chi [Acidovorax sp.]|jgi:DNA polymerase-3 subunit chi|nr:DNA polymerase III subunit chi [Acidovorax sp.]
MTEIAFHFNAPDKLAYACRFARKAQRAGAQLVILAPKPVLMDLDRMLWSVSPQDFVAHCFDDADEDQLAVSPVVLSAELGATPHQDVLLNLGAQVPGAFERFSRLIEVVSSTDEQDRGQARLRWKHYASRGYAIVRHDLVLKGG